MIPIHIEFAIREAVKLLAASRLNFKSRQVEQARRLLERCLAELPARGPQQKETYEDEKKEPRTHPTQKT